MITFWLVVILGVQPGLQFGVLDSFDTAEECKAKIKQAPPQLSGKLACLPVALEGTFDL